MNKNSTNYSEIKEQCSAYIEKGCENCNRYVICDTCCYVIYVFDENKKLIHTQHHGGFYGFLDDNHDIIPPSIAFDDWVSNYFEICPICQGYRGLTSRVYAEYPE